MSIGNLLFAGFILVGSTTAAPIATQRILAPATVQRQILDLEQTVVRLTNDLVQANKQGASADFITGNAQLSSIMEEVLPTGLSCPSINLDEAVEDEYGALASLDMTQTNLALLLLHLQDTSITLDTIATDFCNAYARFQFVQRYVFDVVGSPSNGNSNIPPSTYSHDSPSHDANKLDSTHTASLIALEALISALEASPYTPTDAQKAYVSSEDALATYKLTANPKGIQCQPGLPALPQSAKDAILRVSVVKKAVQTAFADTKENNGKGFYDFCNIAMYMGSVNTFVET